MLQGVVASHLQKGRRDITNILEVLAVEPELLAVEIL